MNDACQAYLDACQAYLDAYLATLPDQQSHTPKHSSADYFCADETNANICADLVLRGIKTATCGLLHWHTEGLEPMPTIGDLMVVTNWSGEPVCIIETQQLHQCRFSEVTAEFAALEGEGEGDQSLAWWREAHRNFFTLECETLGIEFSEDMPVLQEHFTVVYPKNNA